MKQISEEVLYARRAGASHTVSGELANLDNLKECNCSALAHRVGELVKARNECERQFQNKVTKITKLLDDKIMLSKTLEDIKEEYNNIEHTCQERLNIIGRHLDEALKGGA